MNKNMSMEASEILEGLQEALNDAKGMPVKGVKKTIVYRVNPKNVRESLHMSQQEFSAAFGIPLATLRNWEQGRRKIDATASSYLKAIMKYPKEIMAAQ
ncbi:DNA-binding transcriptional regulator [Mitsuokella sp. AF21-1AC]|jgi:putative transcriptional regulator|uniref:helix-turn-helix domain-containing protein n=1 Tax=Mitsuokella sp. AF21-1AC TaxID=2292235 RepID=UPI000E541FCD|nr:helix-turn-helix domain-containing protein [Mitsuokella sp. AF21-1AC]RGS73353.1 helix-turn-helix domain-containing protein [Mitsuokella sp. AF21-1AC]